MLMSPTVLPSCTCTLSFPRTSQRVVAFEEERTIACVSQPLTSRRCTRCPPTNPVAPVTKATRTGLTVAPSTIREGSLSGPPCRRSPRAPFGKGLNDIRQHLHCDRRTHTQPERVLQDSVRGR